MTAPAADPRAAALEAYIAQRAAQGFRVETRSGLQAVLARRHRLWFLLRWVPRAEAERRLVVSVDENGEIDSRVAEPLRW